jgi:hypothetical protein
MKDYKTLITDSTAGRIDTVVKIGSALAEVFFCSYSPSMSYTPQMNPFAKLAFGIAKGTFDVGLSPWYFIVCAYIFSATQLLNEQQKYDENVSGLADGIDGILPFAERALDSVLYEEELLDRVVRGMYDLIGDTVDFVIDYAKRGPASTWCFPRSLFADSPLQSESAEVAHIFE